MTIKKFNEAHLNSLSHWYINEYFNEKEKNDVSDMIKSGQLVSTPLLVILNKDFNKNNKKTEKWRLKK